jgi:rod shape-determining protein MreC
MSVKLEPYEHTVLVNKGSRFGVHPKQPVLDANGIVGQVIRVTTNTAEVMLITDPDHAIPVEVNRNGLRTIAFGTGQPNRLNLPFLANNADVVPGDLLVTSGLGGGFPPGYPVAVVDKFEARPDKSFANIYATPKAELDKSREFLIVWSESLPVVLGEPDKSKTKDSPEASHAEP